MVGESPWLIGFGYANAKVKETNDIDLDSLGLELTSYGVKLGYVYSASTDLDIIPSLTYMKANFETLGENITDINFIILDIQSRYQLSENSILRFGLSFLYSSSNAKSTSTAFNNKLTSELTAIGSAATGSDFINTTTDGYDSNWDESLSVGYEYGFTDNLILDLGISTTDFDTYIYGIGLRWSWGS